MPFVLLPGLAADERLFAPQRERWPHITVPAWLPPQRGESLASYSERMARTLPPGPLVLGGASFGGMVACEIAQHVRPSALVLLGSSTGPLSGALRLAARMAGAMPFAVATLPDAAHAVVARRLGAVSQEHQRLLITMLRDTDPSFAKWACGALGTWRGVPNVHARSIHGAIDRVLRVRPDTAEVVVPGAGHVVSLTHPEPTNAFIARVLQEVG